jgi:hypothetical protein
MLLALYALAALAVMFLGPQVPPCFGDAQGQVSEGCLAQWQAERSLFPDRLVDVVGAPLAAGLTFLGLTCATLLVDFARRTHSRQPR